MSVPSKGAEARIESTPGTPVRELESSAPETPIAAAQPARSVSQHVRDLNDSAGRILVSPWVMACPSDEIPFNEASFGPPATEKPVATGETTVGSERRRYVRCLDDTAGEIKVTPWTMASATDDIPFYDASFGPPLQVSLSACAARRYVRYLDDNAGEIHVAPWPMTSPDDEIPYYEVSFQQTAQTKRVASTAPRRYVRYLDDSAGRILVAPWPMTSPDDEIPHFGPSFERRLRPSCLSRRYVRNLNDCAGQILVSKWVMTSPTDKIPFFEPSFHRPAGVVSSGDDLLDEKSPP